jgi:hypothetical protein
MRGGCGAGSVVGSVEGGWGALAAGSEGGAVAGCVFGAAVVSAVIR